MSDAGIQTWPDGYYPCLVQAIQTNGISGLAYYIGPMACDNPASAENQGMMYYGHDDFIVVQLKDQKCIGVYIGGIKSSRHDSDINGINREYGWEPSR